MCFYFGYKRYGGVGLVCRYSYHYTARVVRGDVVLVVEVSAKTWEGAGALVWQSESVVSVAYGSLIAVDIFLDGTVMYSPTLSPPSLVLGSHGVGHAADRPCAGEAASGRSNSEALLSALVGYEAQCGHEGAIVFQGEGRQKGGIEAQARTIKRMYCLATPFQFGESF